MSKPDIFKERITHSRRAATSVLLEYGATLGARGLVSGKRGQNFVVDRLFITGHKQDFGSGGNFEGPIILNLTNQSGGGGGVVSINEIYFGRYWPTVNEQRPMLFDIQKMGLVADYDDATPIFPPSLGVSQLAVAAATGIGALTNDVFASVRFVDQQSEIMRGLKPGAWRAISGHLNQGPTATLFAAPGLGYYWRIHTICITASAIQNSTTNHITLGMDAVPVNAPIFRIRVPRAGHNGLLELFMTDIDIPVGENLPIAVHVNGSPLSFGDPAALAGRYNIVVGAEKCPIGIGKFINKTGVPA